MTGSLFNGISGLSAHQKALDVESNNIANVNTVGFKSDKISFADMMYQKGVGSGTFGQNIYKDHQQGTFKQTNNPYDIAIQGEGFFAISDPDNVNELFYTRAGNFRMGTTGLLETVDGMNLMGVKTQVSGDKIMDKHSRYISSAVMKTNDSVETINVFSSDFRDTAISTGSNGENLKSKQNNINDITLLTEEYNEKLYSYSVNPIEGTDVSYQENKITFPTTTTSNKYSLLISVNGTQYTQELDTDVETTLKNLSDKISSYPGVTASFDASDSSITINSLIPGKEISINNVSLNNEAIGVSTIKEASGSGKKLLDEIYNKMDELITIHGGEVVKNISTVTKADNNEKPSFTTIELDMDSLGLSESKYANLSLEDDIVYLKDGDAKFAVAQIPVVNFTNSLELDPKGSNRYSQTKNSGEAVYIENSNNLTSGKIELSTADLSESLVGLMIYQKSFDANSKSVMTSNEMLQTAIELKKS